MSSSFASSSLSVSLRQGVSGALSVRSGGVVVCVVCGVACGLSWGGGACDGTRPLPPSVLALRVDARPGLVAERVASAPEARLLEPSVRRNLEEGTSVEGDGAGGHVCADCGGGLPTKHGADGVRRLANDAASVGDLGWAFEAGLKCGEVLVGSRHCLHLFLEAEVALAGCVLRRKRDFNDGSFCLDKGASGCVGRRAAGGGDGGQSGCNPGLGFHACRPSTNDHMVLGPSRRCHGSRG